MITTKIGVLDPTGFVRSLSGSHYRECNHVVKYISLSEHAYSETAV